MALAMVVIFAAADLNLLHPVHRILDLPGADKVGHFALYGWLGWLVARALRERHHSWGSCRAFSMCSLGLFAAAALEECSQLLVSSRTFSVVDLAASGAGIVTLAAIGSGAVGRISGRAASSQAAPTDRLA